LAVTIVAYITHWCPDCVRSRRVLQRSGLPFVEIDIEKTPSAEDAMRAINGGSGKVPTILIESAAGRRVLIEPGDNELSDALRTTAHTDLGERQA
jgi:mycoredoxin